MENSKRVHNLTFINLKYPLILGNVSPSRSLTCDVNTWNAAPVVNPLTKHSDKRNDKTPSRKTNIRSCKSHSEVYDSDQNKLSINFT